MSILIKGMKMPKHCWECSFEVMYHCVAMKRDIDYADVAKTAERPSDCPIVEIQPHGRLIDADALEELALNDPSCITVFGAIKKLKGMPTIIEAEGVSE